MQDIRQGLHTKSTSIPQPHNTLNQISACASAKLEINNKHSIQLLSIKPIHVKSENTKNL